MRSESSRWHEVSPSQFAHERAGLEQIRELVPDRKPFHAWTNFEFRDSQGRWHEVDALVLGERRLHLVELKHYHGTIGGSSYRWQRGRNSEDNPLVGARRKAQRLASLIKDALRELDRSGQLKAPYVQESVFLHHDDFRCILAPGDRVDLFGPDDKTASTNLPGISERLLEPQAGYRNPLIENDDLLVQVFDKIGFTVRREREVGSWRLIRPIADGEGWQDWAAEHKHMHSQRARVRFFVTPAGATDAERAKVRALVKREYDVTSRLNHDGVAKPQDYIEDELGVGLVYARLDNEQRLDLWLTDRGSELGLDDRLRIVRQVAETMKYVHQRHLVHRALSPGAITVSGTTSEPTIKIGDWQFAGETSADDGRSRGTATKLFAADEQSAAVANDPAGAYLAPEARWVRDVDRVRLDVFALGAVAYLVLSGTAPAADGGELRQRVRSQNGLDLAVDVPELASGLRQVVLNATNPMVSDRLADADAFLAGLDAAAEQAPSTNEPDDDPLEAMPGAIVGNRYLIKRRLGSGSTAVGLLVEDSQNENEPYVLKVALNDRAGQRLADEAQVLAQLASTRSPRIVRMVGETPVTVGNRQALILESAGEQTLADELRSRRRLSLDLLDRWGTDLLEAVVTLDAAGISHRDIKPSNLGIREDRKYRTKHLVLFDFSLSRAGASAVEAGTPPYLDPFLGAPQRPTFDSAAERYAAAATLYEMATGSPSGPVFGDGASDPAVVTDEVTLDATLFDPSIAPEMLTFFMKALRRNATERFDTAAEMLNAWRSIFQAEATVLEEAVPSHKITADTQLRVSGLSPRALSALEQLRVSTVGDLAAVDPARLTRLAGVAEATRKEIRKQAKAWRQAFGGIPRRSENVPGDSPLADPVVTAERLVELSGGDKARARSEFARIMLGLEGDADPFGVGDEIARATGKGGPAQVSVLMAELQRKWSEQPEATNFLDRVTTLAIEAINDLGAVAAVQDIVAYLLPADADANHARVATGLLRFAIDRSDDVAAGADEPPLLARRRLRKSGTVLLSSDPVVIDAGTALGRATDLLLGEARRTGQALVPADRVIERLSAAWPADRPRPIDRKLTRLAARFSQSAAVSARGELHDRDLAPATALSLAITGLTPGQTLSVDDVLAYVRSRFPDLSPLPKRPQLDALIAASGLSLSWDEQRSKYAVPADPAFTMSHVSRTLLTLGAGRANAQPGREQSPAHLALLTSLETSAFLALGVPKQRRLSQAVTVLTQRYGAEVLDVSQLVVSAMRDRAQQAGVPWEAMVAADASPHGSREWQGITAIAAQVAPSIEEQLRAATNSPSERPLLLTDAAPLARYGQTQILARLADIATARARATWLLLPLGNYTGPVLDGADLQLSHSGQFVTLDEAWFTQGAVPEGDAA